MPGIQNSLDVATNYCNHRSRFSSSRRRELQAGQWVRLARSRGHCNKDLLDLRLKIGNPLLNSLHLLPLNRGLN